MKDLKLENLRKIDEFKYFGEYKLFESLNNGQENVYFAFLDNINIGAIMLKPNKFKIEFLEDAELYKKEAVRGVLMSLFNGRCFLGGKILKTKIKKEDKKNISILLENGFIKNSETKKYINFILNKENFIRNYKGNFAQDKLRVNPTVFFGEKEAKNENNKLA